MDRRQRPRAGRRPRLGPSDVLQWRGLGLAWDPPRGAETCTGAIPGYGVRHYWGRCAADRP